MIGSSCAKFCTIDAQSHPDLDNRYLHSILRNDEKKGIIDLIGYAIFCEVVFNSSHCQLPPPRYLPIQGFTRHLAPRPALTAKNPKNSAALPPPRNQLSFRLQRHLHNQKYPRSSFHSLNISTEPSLKKKCLLCEIQFSGATTRSVRSPSSAAASVFSRSTRYETIQK